MQAELGPAVIHSIPKQRGEINNNALVTIHFSVTKVSVSHQYPLSLPTPPQCVFHLGYTNEHPGEAPAKLSLPSSHAPVPGPRQQPNEQTKLFCCSHLPAPPNCCSSAAWGNPTQPESPLISQPPENVPDVPRKPRAAPSPALHTHPSSMQSSC